MNLIIEQSRQLPISDQKIEIVERKGLGHPDTICDSIMNQISIDLSKEYLKKFNTVLHHNTDKALLAAGEAEHKFNGGVIKKPMLLVIGDRATYMASGERISVDEIAISAAKKWFKENMRFVDPDEHVKYQVELKQVSEALSSIFKKGGDALGANDTSAVVGYAPMSDTEKTVLELEKFLNSKDFKKEFPESGEDIKVMGLRIGNELDITVSMAFIDRFIDSEHTYFRRKEEIEQKIKHFLEGKGRFSKMSVGFNTLDERGKGIDGLYLTVLGTCADAADSGQVGRGNMINGVIPLNRPTSSEAAAGKNPVSHVGKIYNMLSFKISEEIYNKVSGLKEVYVWMLSQIGQPVDQPKIVAVQAMAEKTLDEGMKKEIEEVVSSQLENIKEFCHELALGKIIL